MSSAVAPKRSEIERTLALILESGQVTELRLLHVSTRQYRRQHVEAGYFDDQSELATRAMGLAAYARITYILPNPVNPALLARASNRVRPLVGDEPCTADPDVVRRRWLMIDLDPKRPSGVSSSDAEHDAAISRAREIAATLAGEGWPLPVVADSGNGAHLLYRVDLPDPSAVTDDLHHVLQALAFRFDDATVQVDTKRPTPSWMLKLYGTPVAKGDDTAERPHRLSRLLDVPEALTVLSLEAIRAAAKSAPEPRRPRARPVDSPHHELDVDEYLRRFGLQAIGPSNWQGGRKWVLPICPWNTSHRNRSSYVVQFADGAIAAGCHHSSCADNHWHELRDLLEPGWREDREARQAKAKSNGHSNLRLVDTVPVDQAPDFRLTDYGNAERLVARHGADLRYCTAQDRWLAWNGRHWQRDETGVVWRLAKDTVRAMYHELAGVQDDHRREELAKHALNSERRPRLEAMVALAQSERTVAVTMDRFDSDPWLFSAANGTVDLRTGEIRPHRREDYITQFSPVAYDPDARLDSWDHFLRTATQDNEDLMGFLRRAAGYSLTGDTSEEKLFLVHGEGNTGKSTFLESLKTVLGQYCRTADFDVFLEQHHAGGARNDVARLAGARMVVSIEVQQGKRLAEALVKTLTGGDTVTARFLYKESFEFAPSFKLWLAANHAPKVSDDDAAIWRRILRIPFDYVVPEAERDPKVKAALRNPDVGGPAILAWAVRGCLEWQREGLGVPRVVKQATAAYRAENDTLGAFVAEQCEVKPGAEVRVTRLRQAYEQWVRQNGEQLVGSRAWGKRLRDLGCVPDKEKRGTDRQRIWIGIRLLDDPETMPLDLGQPADTGGASATKPDRITQPDGIDTHFPEVAHEGLHGCNSGDPLSIPSGGPILSGFSDETSPGSAGDAARPADGDGEADGDTEVF